MNFPATNLHQRAFTLIEPPVVEKVKQAIPQKCHFGGTGGHLYYKQMQETTGLKWRRRCPMLETGAENAGPPDEKA